MCPSQHKREEDVMSDTLVDIDNLVASESDVEQAEDKLDGHSNHKVLSCAPNAFVSTCNGLKVAPLVPEATPMQKASTKQKISFHKYEPGAKNTRENRASHSDTPSSES